MNNLLHLRAKDWREDQGPTLARILVAIPTYRRPALLSRLLRGIADISTPGESAVEVLVMDNDATPSARDLVLEVAEAFPFPLSYAHVSEPGLSSVRNFGLNRARSFDFLAMIDDDEIPQRQWLVELFEVQAATKADAVIGPVPRILPEVAPRWLREGRFFESPAYRDRTMLHDGYSGNCLLRTKSIERLDLSFDQTLNFAGGEDLLFFRELVQRGGKLAYAAHAVAEEMVGTERANATYILKLHFRRGNSLSLCDRHLDNRRSTIATRALKAGALIARGCTTLIPYALFRGETGCFVSLCDVARGVGAFVGLFGHVYQAYERTTDVGS